MPLKVKKSWVIEQSKRSRASDPIPVFQLGKHRRYRWNSPEMKGWHAYRRGLATNLKELGVEDTTIQYMLRHENVSTTQRFYIKTAPQVAHDAMQKLREKISGTPPVPQPTIH